MKAVIVAAGTGREKHALLDRRPLPMTPLVDRPFIQHVVECLVERGVSDFHFVLSHLPEKIETFLGGGERWGARFRFHLARNPERPYDILRAVDLGEDDGRIILGHADRLPLFDDAVVEKGKAASRPALVCVGGPGPGRSCRRTGESRVEAARGAGAPAAPGLGPSAATLAEPIAEPLAEPALRALSWTSWAFLSALDIASLPAGLDEEELKEHLLSVAAGAGGNGGAGVLLTGAVLSVATCTEMLASQRSLLSGKFPGILPAGREIEQGVWLARNASVHPTAQLVPPVFVGENTRVAIGCQVGPNAVVGKDCALDGRCLVKESAVFPGSFVGEALELDGVIADRNILVNARLGADVAVPDAFLLGSLKDLDLRRKMARLASRCAGTLLLAAASPLLLAAALVLRAARQGPAFHRKKVVRLPAPSERARWRTYELLSLLGPEDATVRSGPLDFLLRFLPALANVARGDLGLVGVKPLTREELDDLPEEWRSFYRGAKAGIVTEADIMYGPSPSRDEQYAADAVYAVTASFRHDMKLLARYLAGAAGLVKPSRPG